MKRQWNLGSITVLGLLKFGALIGIAVAGDASAKVWATFVVMWILTELGTTVGYHRMETHGGFKCGPVLQWILFALGAMSLQGQVYDWVLNHRVHHRFQDIPGLDPHSPREFAGLKGLGWAHMGWLLFHYQRPPEFLHSARMEQDRVVMWHKRTRNYLILVGVNFAIPLAIGGWNGLWVAGLLRTVLALHASWSVNSVCHWLGTRAKDSQGNQYQTPDGLVDDSRNNWLVAIVTMGEGYHANHHARPAWAYHGWRWYDFDPSKWVICTLEATGLVWQVKKPKKHFVFERQLQAA